MEECGLRMIGAGLERKGNRGEVAIAALGRRGVAARRGGSHETRGGGLGCSRGWVVGDEPPCKAFSPMSCICLGMKEPTRSRLDALLVEVILVTVTSV